MKKLFLKPAREGLVVRDPANGRPLPPEGEAVAPSSYWDRRLADDDVVKTKPKPAAKEKEA